MFLSDVNNRQGDKLIADMHPNNLLVHVACLGVCISIIMVLSVILQRIRFPVIWF